MLKKWFYPLDDVFSVIALSGVLFFTIINVIFRFVLHSPIGWVEEVTLGLFIWMVFIGISSAMKRGGHVGVDYFMLMMPKPIRNVFNVIGAIAIYFVLIYVFIYLGMDLTSQAAVKITPVLGLSYQYIDIAVPVGGFLTAIHYTVNLIRSFKSDNG
ncbi:TRAP transporter small permease, partial [Schinkia azotoformans]